jgi:two-component system, cell cycle sensor histidine kinase and response regulator CckA
MTMMRGLTRWFAGVMMGGTQLTPVPREEADRRVRRAVDSLPVVMFEFDDQGLYTSVAGGMVSLFGITPELMVGRSVFEFPKFVPGKNVIVRRALAGETVTLTGVWPRGRYSIRFVPRRDENGRVVAVTALGFDVSKPAATDRHFEELLEALRQSEARFRAMCECAPLGICLTDCELYLGYANPALCELLGRQLDELSGRDLETIIAGARVASARVDDAADPHMPSAEAALQIVRSDGTTIWISLRMAAMHDDRELLGYVAVIADVTRERAALLAIDGAREDLRRVIESSPEGIAVVRDGRWVFVNRALAKTLGHTHGNALQGTEVSELVHPDDRGLALELITNPEAVEGGARELRCRTLRGDYVLLELRPALLSEFEGAPGCSISARDVTEQRRLQAQLSVTERLLAVGTLAAGVAHEINNPLSAALSNLEWAAGRLARLSANGDSPATSELACAMAELHKPIDDAREACGRVRGIVQDMKLLSRADEEALRPVELTQVIDSAVRMAWNELRHRARLVREYGVLPLVHGSEARLAQVFLNLLINATQAIPEGEAEQHEVRVSAHSLATGHVVVEVSDTGCGIPEAIRGRIFDPFFTTKPAGIGSGLGLSICQRILSGMAGRLEVDSQVGRGSTFRVTLPVAHGFVGEVVSQEETSSVVATQRARLLIIDDDAAVGAALKLVLSDEHEVRFDTSAKRALKLLSEGERFDVILCDLMMPELSGMEFHRELANVDAELAQQVIFLTGGAFTLSAREFLDRVPNPHLSKPFNWTQLRALIARQLTA